MRLGKAAEEEGTGKIEGEDSQAIVVAEETAGVLVVGMIGGEGAFPVTDGEAETAEVEVRDGVGVMTFAVTIDGIVLRKTRPQRE